ALMQAMEAQPNHVTHVTNLALQLFDGLGSLHALGERERLLLEAAGYLHDIGHQFDHLGGAHHKESARMILEQPWRNFSPLDANVIAQVARYHRKSAPKMKHEEFAMLAAPERRVVQALAALLRIADALDRSHEQHIHGGSVAVFSEKNGFKPEANGPVFLEGITAHFKRELGPGMFSARAGFYARQ